MKYMISLNIFDPSVENLDGYDFISLLCENNEELEIFEYLFQNNLFKYKQQRFNNVRKWSYLQLLCSFNRNLDILKLFFESDLFKRKISEKNLQKKNLLHLACKKKKILFFYNIFLFFLKR